MIKSLSHVWWRMPEIPAVRKEAEAEDECEFETNLEYRVKPCLKPKSKN